MPRLFDIARAAAARDLCLRRRMGMGIALAVGSIRDCGEDMERMIQVSGSEAEEDFKYTGSSDNEIFT